MTDTFSALSRHTSWRIRRLIFDYKEYLFRSVRREKIVAGRNPGLALRISRGHHVLPSGLWTVSLGQRNNRLTETTRIALFTQTIQCLPYGNFSCWVFLGWFPFDFKTAPFGGSRIFRIFNLKNEKKVYVLRVNSYIMSLRDLTPRNLVPSAFSFENRKGGKKANLKGKTPGNEVGHYALHLLHLLNIQRFSIRSWFGSFD